MENCEWQSVVNMWHRQCIVYDKLLQGMGRQLNELLQSVSNVMDSTGVNELIKTGRQYQGKWGFVHIAQCEGFPVISFCQAIPS